MVNFLAEVEPATKTFLECFAVLPKQTLRLCMLRNVCTTSLFLLLGTLSKEKNVIIWEFFPTWGGGLPKSKNFFCKFTKYFFVCQIHSEVLKHVLQMGGVVISYQFLH